MITLQVRTYDKPLIHIQGAGPNTNRSYGVAITTRASKSLWDRINELQEGGAAVAKSLVSDAHYLLITVSEVEESSVILEHAPSQTRFRVNFEENGNSTLRDFLAYFSHGASLEDEDEDTGASLL